jgi:tripartite-type tricarboxylate transporter receptor subunit TctC
LGSNCLDEAGQTPAALNALVRSEIDLWVPIIKKAGIIAQ